MFNTITVIIGTLIGAGFASGKEIFTFFNVYGKMGLCGLVFSLLLIGLLIYKIFYIVINFNIEDYTHFITKVFTRSRFLNLIICNIVNIFLLISFIIMVAGFAAYFSQELNISFIVGAISIATMCFYTFLKNIDGLVKLNKYFIPFLVFIILLLGFKNICCFLNTNYKTSYSAWNWFVSAILYASYNLIILIPILISLKSYVKNTKQAKIVSVFTTIFLLMMSVILFCLLNHYFMDVENIELPTIYISSLRGGVFQYVCGSVILGAILTTATSSGYSFLNNLHIKSKKLYITIASIICILSVLLSNIGFSNLLNLLYPILGFLRFCTNSFYTIFS